MLSYSLIRMMGNVVFFHNNGKISSLLTQEMMDGPFKYKFLVINFTPPKMKKKLLYKTINRPKMGIPLVEMQLKSIY